MWQRVFLFMPNYLVVSQNVNLSYTNPTIVSILKSQRVFTPGSRSPLTKTNLVLRLVWFLCWVNVVGCTNTLGNNNKGSGRNKDQIIIIIDALN